MAAAEYHPLLTVERRGTRESSLDRSYIDDTAIVPPRRAVERGSPLALPVPRIWWAGLCSAVRSSEFVSQFEGEGHGNQLRVAVPEQLCAGRVALASEPPAEAPDQTDSIAEARRGRQLA